ncbi:TIGR03668 family PPOX class F420-dependent oxidoreductase [Amycolatopsis pigmentata]|uniref:TIGR03668 family PPOX class F420-dependent oxidoreductase n=1 Tax=Amycolatopsis pigmentata TaxID=450801 RepID=A0ABW5FN91_9PSEU
MRLSPDDSRERFAAARVAHLATADALGVPHLVPVTFAVHGDEIVFAVDHKPKRSNDLRRLRNIAANPSVAFLADHYDEDWARLWWVRADCFATIITTATEPESRVEPLRWLCAKYRQYADHPPKGPVVRAAVTAWRGWAAS